jgi:diguanylate cyclase (GGDEF)-like protein
MGTGARPSQPAAEIASEPGGLRRLLTVYLAIQAMLVLANFVVPDTPGGVIRFAAVVAGTVALVVGVARRRPEPLTGWWFIVVGALIQLATAVAVLVFHGFSSILSVSASVPVLLAILVVPAFAVGLVVLSRVSPYGGGADMLDAVITAVGGFLLVWTFLVEPVLSTNRVNVAGAIMYTVGALVVFAIAVKLILGRGLRDRPVLLLLLATTLLVASWTVILLPALDHASVGTGRVDSTLWMFYGVTIGAVGLHPSLAQPRRRERDSTSELSPGRVVLYAVLALIAPVSWAVELSPSGRHIGNTLIGFSVPIATSAVFLLLLVVRLGLVARMAQRRAQELARRSAALSAAVYEQEELQEELTYRAMHDPLTGLSNRTVLVERLDNLLSQPAGYGRHALLLFDLDGFKDINDTLGHPTGDEVLVEVARRLVNNAPADVTLVRLGGDEFAVLLENTEPDTARHWAEVLLAAVRQPYSIGGRELFLTTSVGVLIIDLRTSRPNPSDVLRDADLALYAAKEAGKNRIMVFDPKFRSARLHQSRLSTGLRHALANDELVLQYQPIFKLDTLQIASVEALLRWRPAGGPLIPPAEFIPIAEGSGLILPIGAWVLRTACHDARRWYDEHRISVSVNVTGRQISDPGFVDSVIEALAESGLPGSALIIEITESTLVTSSRTPTLQRHLQRLRAAGVRVAIDDFGTGYSSLSYVAELPIDIVKIDKSFTQKPAGPGFTPQEWAFTKAILQLVESLHMLAVAEGVETPEQAEALRILRCPLVQGFYFARPMPAEDIDRKLDARALP